MQRKMFFFCNYLELQSILYYPKLPLFDYPKFNYPMVFVETSDNRIIKKNLNFYFWSENWVQQPQTSWIWSVGFLIHIFNNILMPPFYKKKIRLLWSHIFWRGRRFLRVLTENQVRTVFKLFKLFFFQKTAIMFDLF